MGATASGGGVFGGPLALSQGCEVDPQPMLRGSVWRLRSFDGFARCSGQGGRGHMWRGVTGSRAIGTRSRVENLPPIRSECDGQISWGDVLVPRKRRV